MVFDWNFRDCRYCVCEVVECEQFRGVERAENRTRVVRMGTMVECGVILLVWFECSDIATGSGERLIDRVRAVGA